MERAQQHVVLVGDRMSGKTAVAAAALGLPAGSAVFKVGQCTTRSVSHRGRWFGKDAEDEVTMTDTVSFGGHPDPANSGLILRQMREARSIAALVLVVSTEQPCLSEGLLEFLRLLEEDLGRGFWRQTVLLFTRWYTDDRSCRRRKSSKEQLRQDVSQSLLKEFQAIALARPKDDPHLPSYFVDSEVLLDADADSAERGAAMKELSRFSALVRSYDNFATLADGASCATGALAGAATEQRLGSVEGTCSKKAARAGELVTLDNIFAGALVQPGSSWRWQAQAGSSKLGEVLEWSASTQWATVLWFTS
eukprot:6492195-Amphidinium_carterae.1